MRVFFFACLGTQSTTVVLVCVFNVLLLVDCDYLVRCYVVPPSIFAEYLRRVLNKVLTQLHSLPFLTIFLLFNLWVSLIGEINCFWMDFLLQVFEVETSFVMHNA